MAMTLKQHKIALAAAIASLVSITAVVKILKETLPVEPTPDAMVDAAIDAGAQPPQAAWVSGDLHLHATGCSPVNTPEQLLVKLGAADVQIGAALLWGLSTTADGLNFTGNDHPKSTADHVLHYDLEVSQFKASQFGHLVALGLKELKFSDTPKTSPATGMPIGRWARNQGDGVLIGFAHVQTWHYLGHYPKPGGKIVPYELPIHVALGTADFLSVEGSAPDPTTGIVYPASMGPMLLWAKLISAGYKTALIGATDYPCIKKTVGEWRTLARIDTGETNYGAFLDSVKAGKTVISSAGNDHFVLKAAVVDSTDPPAGIGDEIRIAKFKKLTLTIIPARTENIELYLDGDAGKFATPFVTIHGVAGVLQTYTTWGWGKSGWLSARSPTTQTGALHVVVDGAPMRDPAALCYLIKYVDHLTGLVEGGNFSGDATEALPYYAEAKSKLTARLPTGSSCP